ncbi:hypothetical protein A6A27_31695 [Micromonospora sp. CB01531]|nr:hypothetical protein A6A27_31695 [Micromonospora sp. CB01531]
MLFNVTTLIAYGYVHAVPDLLAAAGDTPEAPGCDNATPAAWAMDVIRARSWPVGMPEMRWRNHFRRPCFSRVFSPSKFRSSMAIAVTWQVVAHFSSRVRA